MTIELNNIGMIKEANVKLDGLTVIAGENDTGKSTVGKALFMFLNHFRFAHKLITSLGNDLDDEIKTSNFISENFTETERLGFISSPKLIFNSNLKSAEFLLSNDNNSINLFVNDNNQIMIKEDTTKYPFSKKPFLPIFIESPLIWNFTDFFRDIAQIESQMGIKVDYPYLMKDLNFKLFIKNASDGIDIKDQVTALINGEFKKDDMGRFFFDRNGQKIELLNTATGIKYFGLFQVLSQNNYLNENTVLILDEPEVHLHPKWQVEMAKLIVVLVKNGVKVLVNSHSPYMIEALKRYADREKVEDKTNFYLAEDGYIKKLNDNNSETLVAIYEKLSEPYDVFEQMESDRFTNG